jgi:hypothetical protein
LERQISPIHEQVLESEKHVHHRVVSALALDPEVQLKTFWENELGYVDGLAKSPLVQPLESFLRLYENEIEEKGNLPGGHGDQTVNSLSL